MKPKPLVSDYRPLTNVELPEFLGRQKYMHSFDSQNPTMPEGYEDYHDVVTDLLQAAHVKSGMVHMTIDEKIVLAGMSQRRPGPHVDGCFFPQQQSWGHGGGWHHDPPGGAWGHSGGWAHHCNSIKGDSYKRMPIIVVSNVEGCRAWRGEFDLSPTDCGDLTHGLDILGEGEVLEKNVGYLLSPDCVHESMLFKKDTRRTFLRLALPTSFIF